MSEKIEVGQTYPVTDVYLTSGMGFGLIGERGEIRRRVYQSLTSDGLDVEFEGIKQADLTSFNRIYPVTIYVKHIAFVGETHRLKFIGKIEEPVNQAVEI